MGKGKSKGPKFAAVKKIITKKTIKKHKEDVLNPKKKDAEKEKLGRNVPQISSALFFSYNTALGPPYRVIVDTNFINFSIQNKLDLEKGMMDCLYAKCTPCITDCVMAELEKLGQKYRVALRIAKDPRFQRLACTHKGTYADDCIVERVTQLSPPMAAGEIHRDVRGIEREEQRREGGSYCFISSSFNFDLICGCYTPALKYPITETGHRAPHNSPAILGLQRQIRQRLQNTKDSNALSLLWLLCHETS